jgi:phosphohistidine phosphatase
MATIPPVQGVKESYSAMKVHSVQHGEAKSEKEDSGRPLVDRVKWKVEAMARYVASCGVEVAEIIHSGKLRAKQTAELFAQYLLPTQGVGVRKELAPLDGPYEAQEFMQGTETPPMTVEHLPHPSRLVSLLILDAPDKEIIKFRMGAVVSVLIGAMTPVQQSRC